MLLAAAAAGVAAAGSVTLEISTGPALHHVDLRFASVTLDIGGVERPDLLELAPFLSHMAPTYFRVGGVSPHAICLCL